MAFPELAELDAYRLTHDLTWHQLAAEMQARLETRVSPRTLHYLVKRLPADAKPLDRTLYKIRLFLKDRQRHARRSTLR